MTEFALAALSVPGAADPWRAIGCTVSAGAIALANGAIRIGGDEVSLEIDAPDLTPMVLDGVRIGLGTPLAPATHPNGAIEFDHVVVMTDSLVRTSEAIEATLGLRQRRLRETPTVRQAFHRFRDVADGHGDRAACGCIIEVVENPKSVTTAIWGIVMNVTDLDIAIASARGLVGEARDAVQSGRRIATVSRSARLPIAVAFMST